MIQVRKSVFETNSSSTHSLVMAVESEFSRWENGEVYYCSHWYSWSRPEDKNKFVAGRFYPVEEVDAYFESIDEERDTYDFSTYDEFCESDSLEVEDYSYTTPGGEVIKAVAKYGYDG
jgi:hypothetical protein